MTSKDSPTDPPFESWAEKLCSSDSNQQQKSNRNAFDALEDYDEHNDSSSPPRPLSSTSDEIISRDLQTNTTEFHARMDKDINDIHEDKSITGPQYVTLDQFNRLMSLMRQMSDQLMSTTNTDSHDQVKKSTTNGDHQSQMRNLPPVSVLPKSEPITSLHSIPIPHTASSSQIGHTTHSSSSHTKHESCHSGVTNSQDSSRQMNPVPSSFQDSRKTMTINSGSVFNQTVFGITVSSKVKLPLIQNHLKDKVLENY
jgi:hypothetical protein